MRSPDGAFSMSRQKFDDKCVACGRSRTASEQPILLQAEFSAEHNPRIPADILGRLRGRVYER